MISINGHFCGARRHTARSRAALVAAKSADSILSGVRPAPSSNLFALTAPLDQTNLGSCTANAVAQAERCALVRAGMSAPEFVSRLALYQWALIRAGEFGKDAGSEVSTILDVACLLGLPGESVWPYDVSKFGQRPPTETYRAGYGAQGSFGLNYYALNDYGPDLLDDIRKALTLGYPVAFASEVTQSFCSTPPSGPIPAPGPLDAIAGGHAQTIIGHDDVLQAVLVKDSWGDYGDPACQPGCAWFSYDYVRQQFYDANIVLVSPREVQS